jgi:hypothetical protein
LNHHGLNNSGNVEGSWVAQNRETMRKGKFNSPENSKEKSLSFIWRITSSKMVQFEFGG